MTEKTVMHCLEARRIVEPGVRSSEEERAAALAHLDDCPACGREAPEIDPLLALRRLPALEVEAGEVAAMQQAVASLRRMPPVARRQGHRWMLAAAVAATALGLLLHPVPPHEARTAAPMRVELAAPAALGSAGLGSAGLGSAGLGGEFMPSVEALAPASAYVATQVAEEDLTLVILANVDVGGR